MQRIQVRVKPNARVSRLEASGDTWVAYVKSPPVDGKANREVLRLVAAQFAVPVSRVILESGARGRLKRVRIRD